MDLTPAEWHWAVTEESEDPPDEDDPPAMTLPPPDLVDGSQTGPPASDQPQAKPPEEDSKRRRPRKPPIVSNERTRTYWSYVYRDSNVYRRPARKSKRIGRIARFTYYGLDDVVLVLRRKGRWSEVRYSGLGRRTGWVWSRALSRPRLTRMQVVVSRRTKRLTVYREGRRVMRAPVGVGARGSPTPGGRFFLRERIVPHDEGGIYGALAFGTSTYSRYRTDWPGGGQVGVHGTDQPGLIPGRISNGCVRVRNRSIRRVDRVVGIGTPLRVR